MFHPAYFYLRHVCLLVYRKNDFAKVFRNLARHRSENNFVGLQNNYVGRSS